MGDEKVLTVIEQREVEFYGDGLTAIRADDGHIYVSVRHMCDALSLSRPAQVRRIRRNEILDEGYKGGAILAPPSPDGRGGGMQEAGLLRVDLVPLWLTGISIKSVKEEIQPKLKQYQREAAKVLWEAFQDGRLTVDPSFEELLQQDSEAVQAYKMIEAMFKLARNQVLIEARLSARLDVHELRLESIETQLGTSHTVTPDQATSISQAVKAVARELGKQTGRNEYGGVYGELYRRYRIPSYRELPVSKYDDAIKWLGSWYQDLTGEEPF